LAVAALLAAMLFARRMPASRLQRFDLTAALEGRVAPQVIGVVTFLLCWYVWGHLQPTPIIHDEASYLLQAKIFARGAFAMPARPFPEFFEQFHTYVTPATASKYPPGHPLVLAPGALVGWPALVPLLLDGLSGALIFLIARRIANPWVALLTWLIWITPRQTFHHIASYFSQSSSLALCLLGWWALLSWRDDGRRGWLVVLSTCIAWLAITRPVTALAYALPVAVVVIALVVRRRAWPALGVAMGAGILILGLLPWANMRTTGDWRTVPLTQYSQIYFPFDAPGFGLDTTPPQRELPADMVEFTRHFRPIHVGYGPPMLLEALGKRFVSSVMDLWIGPRIVLALAALAAVSLLGVEAAFALATMATVFVFYLSFAHGHDWTIYYAETAPIVAFLSALGVWRLLAGLRRIRAGGGLASAQPAAAVATSLLVVVFLPAMVADWRLWRAVSIADQRYQRAFFETVRSLPEPRTMVFVRYAPTHSVHRSLIANEPDLAEARAWIVYDRGADNDRLRRLAPDRTAYLFDEARLALLRYPPITAGRDPVAVQPSIGSASAYRARYAR